MRTGLMVGAILAAISAGGLQAMADGQGLYTAAQAGRGATIFAQQCATCHGASLEGVAGPALKGPAFHQMAVAQNLNAASVLQVVSESMPQDNPGSLSPAQYADLVAYILQQNGYPAGDTDLSSTTPGLKDLNLSQ